MSAYVITTPHPGQFWQERFGKLVPFALYRFDSISEADLFCEAEPTLRRRVGEAVIQLQVNRVARGSARFERTPDGLYCYTERT